MGKINLNLLLFLCLTFMVLVKQQEIKVIKSLDEFIRVTPRGLLPIPVHSKEFIRNVFLNASSSFNKRPIAVAQRMIINTSNLNQTNQTTGHSSGLGATKQSSKVHKLSTIAIRAARSIMQTYPTNVNSTNYIKQYKAPEDFCPYSYKPQCDTNYPYRNADGSCNNIANSWWGMSETPFKRLLEASYNDGLDEPRSISFFGRKLPNPRTISLKVHTPKDTPTDISNFFSHFGQFIDHDITATALVSDENGTPIKCFCNNLDTDCANIPVPSDDEFGKDQRCMVTPRSSASFQRFGCNLGAREQLNLNTHWLDLSQIYGNNFFASSGLRTFKNGLLVSKSMKGVTFPYPPFDKNIQCANIKKGMPCFQAGDSRINQNLLLTSMHAIWIREHNRVAKALLKINPNWDDEKLYQETKRIVIAEYQHVVYQEWLPVLLGDKVIKLYELKPLNQDYFLKYDPKLYPNIINEFSTAAFRFGHSLVSPVFNKADKRLRPFEELSLIDLVFDTTHAFKKGGLDAIARGCLIDGSNKFDLHVTNYLNNHLFENLNPDSPTHRFSLPALNINRGREHGLQPYNEYRALCGLNYATKFEDLFNIPPGAIKKLQSVYEHVYDMDLFTGGISERPIEGGVVGATFACIIAKQFKDLKYGDRFYYENGQDPLTRFSSDQLDEIRKTTLARLICDNLELDLVQQKPFLRLNPETNPLIDCKKLKKSSYENWKDYYNYYY